METLRRCGDDYIPFGNGISFPESGKLFTDRDELRQIECGLKFVDDCLKGVPKTAAFLTLNSIKEYTESVCAVGTERIRSSYGTAEDCVHQVLAPCKEVGADEYATAVLKQVFGRTLELVCDKYAGNSDACKSLPTLPELGPNDPKAENYVELLIRAANTIGHRN
ncbi:hypothetical protein MTO96_026580 [Rhipicephalus appendiculatus]